MQIYGGPVRRLRNVSPVTVGEIDSNLEMFSSINVVRISHFDSQVSNRGSRVSLFSKQSSISGL